MARFSFAIGSKSAKRTQRVATQARARTARFLRGYELLEQRSLLTTLSVVSAADSGPGSLRDTIGAAQNGDTIVFDSSLQGQTINLTSGELAITKNLDIAGLGADQLTVSGDGASRVFDLNGSGADVIIAGLTIADGLATQGGGIQNLASNLTLADDVLSKDQAVASPGGLGQGGGIYNGSSATLQVRHTAFMGNVVQGGPAAGANGDAGACLGGGLFNAGTATVADATFRANQARGGDGGPNGVGGNGIGGAITNEGTLTVDGSTFDTNQAVGGKHGRLTQFPTIGAGAAAGIYNVADLAVSNSIFTDNQAVGGAGYAGVKGGNGNGAAILSSAFPGAPPASASISNCTFLDNQAVGGAGGAGAVGGQGSAGGVLADRGSVSVQNSAFIGNQALGGTGANGGNAVGGAFRIVGRDGNISALVTDSIFFDNQALGGAGSSGVGGLADGGAVANVQNFANNNLQSLTLADCLVLGNEAVGGAGSVGGAARGGGVSSEGGPTLTISGIRTTATDTLILGNLAQGAAGVSGNGGNGQGGGVYNDATSNLELLATDILFNRSIGGAAGSSGSAGQGAGGGLYVAPGGTACADARTLIFGNYASTTDDDIFGTLGVC